MAATKIQAIMRGKQARSNPSSPTSGTEDNVPESTPPAPAQGSWTLSEVGEDLNAVDSGASALLEAHEEAPPVLARLGSDSSV